MCACRSSLQPCWIPAYPSQSSRYALCPCLVGRLFGRGWQPRYMHEPAQDKWCDGVRQAALDAPSPCFSMLRVIDLLPERLRAAYLETGAEAL